ncbi:sensor histidine kinase KdpD [Dehalobacter sp. DCM]|uniref:sensor histidine kinase n=1 Tax=Dehalobacter sp. DCM TaxID=2907827 RepID=UPI003082183B|nr:sensor histidine kinase KdpD [Dehalobacter sp. DCM]
MTEEFRGDPDAILAGIKHKNRGILTVFLGAAAGVGKTYAMLEAAQEMQTKGIETVIALVETHGRKETEALVKGLPIITSCVIEYKDKQFCEMDLDAILLRRPEIALVDELAHTNISGSRHPKRYQDVEELLAAGINVYTTLNIQHIESLNDIVARITGVTVRETVPDRILNDAKIHLVDIPDEELIQRLKEGKVYVPDQAERAINKFFRPGNLNALRELALRYTAQRVDRQMETYMQAHAISGPWPAGEKVLVSISSSPFASKLLRMGSRMANRLQSELIAVYVESSRQPLKEEQKELLTKNLNLAEELGAEILTVTGDDIAEELLEIAKKRNVTQIIIGKPLRSGISGFLRNSPVDKIIRNSEGISVHVIPGQQNESNNKKTSPFTKAKTGLSIKRILLITAIIVLWTVMLKPFEDSLGLVNIVLLFLLPVLYTAVTMGIQYAIVAAFLGVIVFDFFFVFPQYSFTVADIRYGISFLIFIIVAIVTGRLSTRLHNQIYMTKSREEKVSALYSLSKDIAAETEVQTVLDLIVKKIAGIAENDVIAFLPDEKGDLEVAACSSGGYVFITDPKELAVATWSFLNRQSAGKGTENLSGAQRLYLPMMIKESTTGVLGIRINTANFTPEQRILLEAFAGLSAVALSRIQLAEKARETQLLKETERLYNVLFSCLSHDLKTPLASIIGAITGLLDDKEPYTTDQRKELLTSARQGAERMNRLINNLLDMARVESGGLQLNQDECDIAEIISVAVNEVDPLQLRIINSKIERDLPLFIGDCMLIKQVLVNLLENAIKYTEQDRDIEISATKNETKLKISVMDRGNSIQEDDLGKIFDKFYRLNSSSRVSGTGLGLTVCKSIVEAHQGKIWAERNLSGGTTFVFTIPFRKSLVPC